MQIVVYLRTRPAEPDLSAAALTRQQEAVAAWLDENGATLIGTFTETETSTKAARSSAPPSRRAGNTTQRYFSP